MAEKGNRIPKILTGVFAIARLFAAVRYFSVIWRAPSDNCLDALEQETIGFSKQPIRTRYLGHVTGYQPIKDKYFLIRTVPDPVTREGS